MSIPPGSTRPIAASPAYLRSTADHIVYGSSYPIRRDWFTQGVGFIKNLDIDEKAKSLILSENAIRLFNIK